jgi:hypothetical protein
LKSPDVAPYVPTGHPVHAPALNVPAEHINAVGVVDPGTHAYPALQFPEHIADVSPAMDPNRPAGHCVHNDTAPRLNLPGVHREQTAEAAELY